MLYQKLLMGNKPYHVAVGKASAFETHRHPEIELRYCMEGAHDIICEKKRHSLSEGDFAVIGPMAAHEFPENNTASQQMTIELGYTLLGTYFETFTVQKADCRIYKQCEFQHTAFYKQMVNLLEETAELQRLAPAYSELLIKGNLYKISALILQMSSSSRTADMQSKKLTDVKKIDQALDIIYNRYHEALGIEEVSASCGYSKSNFCKIFKAITGNTFHNTLNLHRVEIACMLLRETNDTIEKIALETGFADAKSFCRVFKNFMGKNAGEYRKYLKEET